jgi:hypothetical protein
VYSLHITQHEIQPQKKPDSHGKKDLANNLEEIVPERPEGVAAGQRVLGCD